MAVIDLAVRCHWYVNPSDAEGGREMLTPRVSEDIVDHPLQNSSNSLLLVPVHFQPLKKTYSLPWTLNTFEGDLNIEANLERTEAALRELRWCSLCVVLMSSFVPTVAFQIHANRRSVFCVALYWRSLLWTLQLHVVPKDCVTSTHPGTDSLAVLKWRWLPPAHTPSRLTWPPSQFSCWQTRRYWSRHNGWIVW